MTYRDYKHIIPIQLRFNDVDRLNHVNNACYLSFFELGRVKYFNQVLNKNINWNEKGFITARTEIDHLTPLYLLDEVYCCTKIIKLGTKSMTIKNVILKKVDGNLIEAASGIGILVAMDYLKKISIEIPTDWRKLIEDFEK
ncbi:MAG: acyl-CoA thioesterase [Bacteroidetes bacterium]|nr:acyl-CoA thioesterase [Bacteroidota bacterium]